MFLALGLGLSIDTKQLLLEPPYSNAEIFRSIPVFQTNIYRFQEDLSRQHHGYLATVGRHQGPAARSDSRIAAPELRG